MNVYIFITTFFHKNHTLNHFVDSVFLFFFIMYPLSFEQMAITVTLDLIEICDYKFSWCLISCRYDTPFSNGHLYLLDAQKNQMFEKSNLMIVGKYMLGVRWRWICLHTANSLAQPVWQRSQLTINMLKIELISIANPILS